MRILLSNDDGINSPGIRLLAHKLCDDHEIYVVAPDRERSAAGHSLTLHHPLRVEEVTAGFKKNITAWETNGTPGDCVDTHRHQSPPRTGWSRRPVMRPP